MYTNLVLCELAGINELVLLITGTSPLYSVRGRLTCLSDPGDKIWQGEKIPYKPINHGNREYANFIMYFIHQSWQESKTSMYIYESTYMYVYHKY